MSNLGPQESSNLIFRKKKPDHSSTTNDKYSWNKENILRPNEMFRLYRVHWKGDNFRLWWWIRFPRVEGTPREVWGENSAKPPGQNAAYTQQCAQKYRCRKGSWAHPETYCHPSQRQLQVGSPSLGDWPGDTRKIPTGQGLYPPPPHSPPHTSSLPWLVSCLTLWGAGEEKWDCPNKRRLGREIWIKFTEIKN